ncbi:MAG TPA: ADOP family duplicated permease [Bryobacteraceae bacterium]|nr:ADOP family duplicated permease [Bryobacteraceae bacterium]
MLRSSLRSLSRNKRYSVAAVLVLALGMSSALVVFSVLDAVLLRPANFADAESVVEIQAAAGIQEWGHVSAPVLERLRAERNLFAQIAAARMGLFTMTNVPVPDQVFGLSVAGAYFEMLGARPWLGRLLSERDEQASAPAVAVLSYRAWQQLFRGDAQAIGRAVSIDGASYTIVGVLPADFVVPGEYAGSMLWVPLRLSTAEWRSDDRNLQIMARLLPSVGVPRANEVLRAMALSLTPERGGGEKLRLRAESWEETGNPDQRIIVWLAMGMTGGLLAIGCANLCSLLLARGIARRREYAVRLALGGRRADLMRDALGQMLILAVFALTLSLGMTWIALPVLRNALTESVHGIPNLARMHLDGRAVLFGFGVASLCAFVCGLLPAWIATSMDAASGLRESGAKVAGSRPVRRFLRAVVALETAVSMMLLVTSLLLVRSLQRLLSEDHGMRSDHVLTLRLPKGSWHGDRSVDPKLRITSYMELLDRAQAMQGVQAAALASSLPLSHTVVRTRIETPRLTAVARQPIIEPVSQSVTRDYFRAMGIPLLAGRSFEAHEPESKVQPALVNEAFARAYFRGANPVGQLLRDPDSKGTIQVIGLVKDSPHLDLAERVEPEIYFDFEQQLFTPFLTGLVVRTYAEPETMEKNLRAVLSLGDAAQAVVHVATMKSLIRENTWQPRFSGLLFSIFAGLAVLLSALGVYGVVAYAAAASRREYGIRAALGAGRANLFGLVTGQSLLPVATGMVLGVAGALGMGEWIRSILYETGPFDGVAMAEAVAIFLLVTMIATAGPATQAGRVDPAVCLREE